ncbi:hypothetical protein [Thermoflexus hugenholtzii]
MTMFLNIHFLDSQTLGKPGILEDIIAFFEKIGFDIKEFEVNNEKILWKEDLYLAYNAKNCWFSAFNSWWRFEVHQIIAWDVPELGGLGRHYIRTINNNEPYFWEPEKDPEKYARFYLDIGKGLYTILQPTFGWIEWDLEWLPTRHEDIENLRLPALYWANFFGPPYVQKLGREKILKAPAWRIEELPDGGLLYILASSPGWCKEQVSLEEVKAYFGVERVR